MYVISIYYQIFINWIYLLIRQLPDTKDIDHSNSFKRNNYPIYEDEHENNRESIISTQIRNQNDQNMCVCCIDEVANTAFIHGKTAHTKCCSKCAVKIMETIGRCPDCNIKAEKIVTVF